MPEPSPKTLSGEWGRGPWTTYSCDAVLAACSPSSVMYTAKSRVLISKTEHAFIWAALIATVLKRGLVLSKV